MSDKLSSTTQCSPQFILVVDDELSIRTVLRAQLQKIGFQVKVAANGLQALEMLREWPFSLVLTDLRMPKMDGISLLKECKSRYPTIPIIVLTAHGTVNNAVEAMKLGAFDFLNKPFDKNELHILIQKAISESASRELQLHENKEGRFNIIGRTKKLQSVYTLIEKVANTRATVLIIGESGTGKELVARALHDSSEIVSKPFIQLNCGAIPENLFESEIFGHEKGAFTGAVHSKPGKFELADGGTLFLDEIGELPKEMQVKLLRLLQDGTYTRVGGLQVKKANVRLVAATNRNLKEEVKNGNFREDLFYRLNVVPITLPPLRERIEDLPLLIEHFIKKSNHKFNKDVSPAVALSDLQALQLYKWPGNIRELENLIERAVLLSNNNEIGVDDFLHPEISPEEELGLKDFVRLHTSRLEKQRIRLILESCNGNVTHTAKQLGISRKSLQNKMREYNLRDIES
jgi:two-component system, NtrC family, response regulator AtoC